MPYLKPERPEKLVRLHYELAGERLVCLTAYDYPTARIVDEAGIDVVLVGDSLGNVVLGYGNTVPVTLDEIMIHLKAVRRAVQRALLVADMPYGSFHTGPDDAVKNALRLVKEGGAEAVKLEGGRKRLPLIKRLVDEEIAVMGHIGLTPQSINKLGAYRVQGKTAAAAENYSTTHSHWKKRELSRLSWKLCLAKLPSSSPRVSAFLLSALGPGFIATSKCWYCMTCWGCHLENSLVL